MAKNIFSITNITWILGLIFLILPTIVKATDDDECLLCDAAAGAAIAICEQFATCRALMTIFTITCVFVTIIACIYGLARGLRG